MKSFYIILICVLILTGCRPCKPVITDRGPLTEELLEKIPYKDGEYVRFEHSNGLIISFYVKRFTEKRRESLDHCWCCDELIWEDNITVLSPDYPIFDFKLTVSNADTSAYPIWGRIGKNSFMIHDERMGNEYANVADSLIIDGRLYHSVYQIKFEEFYWDQPDILSVDSVMYNIEYGILKVVMTNGEQYLKDE